MVITNQQIVNGQQLNNKQKTEGLRIALFDTEGDGLLDECTRLWCAVVEDYKTGERIIFRPEDVDRLPACLDGYDAIVCHNLLGHDLPVMRKLYKWEYKGKLIDTLLISRVQRPDRPSPDNWPADQKAKPHSIEAWGYRFGNLKQEHEDWSQYSEDMMSRCVQDVAILRQVYDALIEEGKDENWREAHRLNHTLFYHLQRQEEYGWLVDRDWFQHCVAVLDRYIRLIDHAFASQLPLVTEPDENKKGGVYNYVKKPFLKSGELAKVSQEFLERLREENEAAKRGYPQGIRTGLIAGGYSRISFRPVDLNSNKETKDFLLAQGWIPKEYNRDKLTGQETSPKLSKTDPFDGIEGRLGKLIARRVQCRHRKSQVQGWLDNIRPDGRISARVGGIAATGRLTHKVIVNVPNADSFFGHHMRKGFICKPGYVLVGTDSKGNQMRQLAGRLKALDGIGDTQFEKAVLTGNSKDGTDLHTLNQKRSGVATRTLAKNFFYGCILFGAGLPKTAKIIGGSCTVGQAKLKKEEFLNEMPLLKKLLEVEQAAWRETATKTWNWKYKKREYKNGYITGLDGRPILVEFEKDILVYYLQSDEALQLGAAYCWAHKQLNKKYKYGEDWGFVIWMHDEFQVECREEIAQDVANICCEAIAWAGRYFNIQCPHEGESKIGKNWADTH